MEPTPVTDKSKNISFDFLCASVVNRSLFAADEESVNANGRASNRAAEFEIIPDLRDVEEHLFQIACNCDFFDGVSKFPPRNPEAGCSARIVAGHQVGAVAQKFGYVETVWNGGNNFLRSFLPWL